MLTMTPRQADALAMLAGGANCRQVADALGIEKQTLAEHLRRARVANRAGSLYQLLYMYGMHHGEQKRQ